MMPNNNSPGRNGSPLEPQRHFLVSPPRVAPLARPAAVGIIRSQINAIYNGNTTTPTPQTTPLIIPSRTAASTEATQPQPTTQTETTDSFEVKSPYERTHLDTPQPQAEQWQKYHSAWQDYYKQYYERYYVNQVQAAHQALSAQTAITGAAKQAIGGSEHEHTPTTTDGALRDLRSNLRERVQTSARQVRKSRHFVPLVAAIVVIVAFSFLQYNRVIFANVAAYVAPGSIDPQDIIIDPTTNQNVGPESKLIIPKINVDVPVIYGVANDHDSQMDAMVKGVMHFSIPGASSVPGQVGNMVIAGHSSNDILDTGDYKFIFAQNDKLEKGDTIYINYKGTRYTYSVTKKEIVLPTDVSALTYPTDKPVLTLITCVPLGTALKRLLVTAEQVSPDPAKAAPAPDASSTPATSGLPGNSPTFVERLFGAN